MIDESKLIFFTGAPGSKWSAVANILALNTKIKMNISDRSEDRMYHHGQKFNSATHIGAYFGPGMEVGPNWHRLNEITKEEVLLDIAMTFDEHDDGYYIIKCHQMVNNLDWIRENFPTSKIMITFRPIESCYRGWFGSGGFDITYPTYRGFYKDDDTARDLIAEETKDARQWLLANGLRMHVATEKHWVDFWGISKCVEGTLEHKIVRSIEGYIFAMNDPARNVAFDTNVAYYNFEDIDDRL